MLSKFVFLAYIIYCFKICARVYTFEILQNFQLEAQRLDACEYVLNKYES